MAQSWQHLLFAHWRVDPAALRPLIPAGLEIDTYNGEVWVGVVPFTMIDVHARGLPNLPGTSTFPELNVRTYVTRDGKPGVWFFSLDATNRLAVWGARRFFHLPYYKATMRSTKENEWVRYASRRSDTNAMPAEFHARYRPISPIFRAEAGSLEAWLTERYCLYTTDRKGRICRCEVHHPQWRLRRAEAEISVNTMIPAALGARLIDAPVLHYSERLDVLTWTLERLDG